MSGDFFKDIENVLNTPNDGNIYNMVLKEELRQKTERVKKHMDEHIIQKKKTPKKK